MECIATIHKKNRAVRTGSFAVQRRLQPRVTSHRLQLRLFPGHVFGMGLELRMRVGNVKKPNVFFHRFSACAGNEQMQHCPTDPGELV